MKAKYAVIILAVGFCVDFYGALVKMLHHPHADNIFITGTVLKITGLSLLVWKILTNPKLKDFLDN